MNQSVPISSLIESGEQIKSLLQKCSDFFPDLIFLYDLNRDKVIHVNNRLYDLLGVRPSEITNRDDGFHSMVFKEDALLFRNVLEVFRKLSFKESRTFVARFNHSDGSYRFLSISGTVIPGEFSQTVSVFFVAHDVTEKIRLEEEAKATRQLFDETEKMLSYGTWSWSPSGDRMEWTDGMYHLLEYEAGEVNITNDFYLNHVLPEHFEKVQQVVSQAIEANKGFEVEYVIRTKSGREKYVYTEGNALVDINGNLKKFIGITRDITHTKTFEKDRDRIIRELNRSNKELEEFAYVASHDLHEPLRKILTFSERIKSRLSGSLGDEGRVYIERISASAANMRALIDHLLEFSRLSKSSRSFVKCDIDAILKDVLSDQELRIEESSTQIDCTSLPEVEGVPSELRQLFNNLISNALKFRTRDGTPVIHISCRKLTYREKSDLLLPFNEVFYQIAVQDNGIGFDPMYAEKIFEIFQRLHGKSEYSGSGIGLAICKKIVENHGGSISALSEPGKGSVFTVILPEKQLK